MKICSLFKDPFGSGVLIFEWEGKEYFKFVVFGSIFRRGGEGRERKGSKIPNKLIYCSPSNWSFLEGRGRKER